MRRLFTALVLIVAALAFSAGCGKDPCPPFIKAVCGQCGEKSAACVELNTSLARAKEERRDIDALCERGHDEFKSLEGDRCRTTP